MVSLPNAALLSSPVTGNTLAPALEVLNSAVVIKTIKRPTIHGDWNFRQVTDGIYESIFDINVLPVTHGGTGLATVTPGGILYGDGQGNLVILPIGTTGQTLKVHSSGVPFWSS